MDTAYITRVNWGFDLVILGFAKLRCSEHIFQNLGVVQLQLGWSSSLTQGLDRAFANLHDVVKLANIMRQILRDHTGVHRLVRILVVHWEGTPQA